MNRTPWPNSRDMDRLSKAIMEVANNKKAFGALLRYLTGILEEAKKQAPSTWSKYGNSLIRIKDFTSDIESRLLESIKEI